MTAPPPTPLPQVRWEPNHTTIRLSDTVTVTLTIVDSEPPQVRLPKQPLDEVSSAIWRAVPIGEVKRERTPDGAHRWSLAYRVEPFVPGEAVPLVFAPVKLGPGAGARTVECPPLTIQVVTGVTADAATELRPVTAVEAVPISPTSGLPSAGIGIAIAFGLLLFVVWMTYRCHGRRRRVGVRSPLEEAQAELEELRHTPCPDAEFASRLSYAVRTIMESRFEVPAGSRSTAELIEDLSTHHDFGSITDLHRLLNRLDEVRFAKAPLATEERSRLLDSANELTGVSHGNRLR